MPVGLVRGLATALDAEPAHPGIEQAIIVVHVAVNPDVCVVLSDLNLSSTLVPDDVLLGGTDGPETPSSKAVELVVVPSYIHNLSQHDSVSKAENEMVTDAASATMITW